MRLNIGFQGGESWPHSWPNLAFLINWYFSDISRYQCYCVFKGQLKTEKKKSIKMVQLEEQIKKKYPRLIFNDFIWSIFIQKYCMVIYYSKPLMYQSAQEMALFWNFLMNWILTRHPYFCCAFPFFLLKNNVKKFSSPLPLKFQKSSRLNSMFASVIMCTSKWQRLWFEFYHSHLALSFRAGYLTSLCPHMQDSNNCNSCILLSTVLGTT